MLKKRVIPTLLLKNKRMVKGKKFSNYRDVGDPISAVKIYNNQHADELMFIDINEEVFLKEKDPLSLYPFKYENHYTREAYEKIANIIFESSN